MVVNQFHHGFESCKRRRTELNGDKKREICVYKDAHPKATCSDIAAQFAKEWDVTVGRITVGDILRSKEKWMSHEQQNMASLKKHLCCMCCGLIKNLIKKNHVIIYLK